MKHIIVDLEMNHLAKEHNDKLHLCGMEVIEIGAVVLDESYQEIGAFKTLVKPQFNDVIVHKISRLTGITTSMVAEAPIFEEALKMFFSWCESLKDEIHIYQWSESDLRQIQKEILLKGIVLDQNQKQLLDGWENLQKEYGEKLNRSDEISLEKAIMYAGVDFDGHEHDALDDARNTAALLKILRTPGLCEKTIQSIIDALTPSKVNGTLGSMFNFAALGFTA